MRHPSNRREKAGPWAHMEAEKEGKIAPMHPHRSDSLVLPFRFGCICLLLESVLFDFEEDAQNHCVGETLSTTA